MLRENIKGSSTEEERHTSYDITYMWNLKKMIQMNLFIKQKQKTHRERKQSFGFTNRESGSGGAGDKLGIWD